MPHFVFILKSYLLNLYYILLALLRPTTTKDLCYLYWLHTNFIKKCSFVHNLVEDFLQIWKKQIKIESKVLKKSNFKQIGHLSFSGKLQFNRP